MSGSGAAEKGSSKKNKKNKNKKASAPNTSSGPGVQPQVAETVGKPTAAAPTAQSIPSPKEASPAPHLPEVSIIRLDQANKGGTASLPAGTSSAGVPASQEGSKKKRKKKKKQGAAVADAEPPTAAGPEVTVIPLNKDPGAIPAHLNPAVVLTQRGDSNAPKVIECSPVVTLIGSNKKAKGHGALYKPPPTQKAVAPPEEDSLPPEQLQTISGGFKFPSSLQPVFETGEAVATSTSVVLNQETSGVLTIVPVRQEGEKKWRNRNKVVPPCCELRGSSGLEVVCPHSKKLIPNYNFVVNEDKEKVRQLQETQESLQHIDDPEVLDSLASIDHSVTIKLVGSGHAEKTVHREGQKTKTILVEAADVMKKNAPAKQPPLANGAATAAGGDPDKEEKARLKAERKAAFEAKRAAELAAAGGADKENKKEISKAERRALQEAQRAKKAQAKDDPKAAGVKGAKSQDKPAKKEHPSKETSPPSDKKKDALANKKVSFADLPPAANTPFAHMHVRGSNIDKLAKVAAEMKHLHPAVLQLGYRIAEDCVAGANQRCTGMLEALRKLVQDFGARKDQDKKDVRQLSKDLSEQIDENVTFLRHCRPLSVSMANALAYVKAAMAEESTESFTAAEFATTIEETMKRFVDIEIDLARRAIVANAKDKITDGDVVLTYARSSLIREILLACLADGKKFSVVVVDSRPRLEGRETLRLLCRAGIKCKYLFINSLPYIMKEVTKVLLGADTLLANGYVASKIGSSQIALIASGFNVPVLVCCETYKFSDKVLTDPFIDNELGSTDQFLLNLSEQRQTLLRNDLPPRVSLVDLTFDITPPEFVTCVVTERGCLPCTSVPVVVRVRQNVLQ